MRRRIRPSPEGLPARLAPSGPPAWAEVAGVPPIRDPGHPTPGDPEPLCPLPTPPPDGSGEPPIGGPSIPSGPGEPASIDAD